MYEITDEHIRFLRDFVVYETEKASAVKLQQGVKTDGVFTAEREETYPLSEWLGKRILCIFGTRICAVVNDILYLDTGSAIRRVPLGAYFEKEYGAHIYRISIIE